MAVHTLQEAAEILRMPYRTLRDHVFAGRWPHRYVSPRRRMMTDEDIEATLLLLTRSPEPTANPTVSDERARRKNVLELLNAA